MFDKKLQPYQLIIIVVTANDANLIVRGDYKFIFLSRKLINYGPNRWCYVSKILLILGPVPRLGQDINGEH